MKTINEWIGYKVIARDFDNSTKIKIELYTENTGKWIKIAGFIDNIGLSTNNSYCCDLHCGNVLPHNNSIFLNLYNFGINKLILKNLSIREINPQ